MQNRFIYPVDTYSFTEIREQGKVYVDKTDLIYDIIQVRKYKYIFLARPRRFGKSLLCSTLHAYFEGKKDLFEGLKIAELEKDWKQYPVLHFDMSSMRNCKDIKQMEENLCAMLSSYESQYAITNEYKDYGTRLSVLLKQVKKKTGQSIVVIIDEYDTPLLRNLYNENIKEDIRRLLRNFYQTLKIEDDILRFVFITGVTKFSQLSIFSELNNLNQISMLDEYSGLCGITQEELDTVLRPGVEDFAEANECTVDEAYDMLKRMYDGYHFSEKSKDVYAPFSLLRALDTQRADSYWFESGTSSSLIEHLKHFPKFNPLEYDGKEVMGDEFNIPCEDASTPMPLLYQSGYLSIDTYNKKLKTYVLHFPNLEVRTGMIKSLAPLILQKETRDNNALVMKMAQSLFNGNLQDALAALRAYIASIPYDIITKQQWEQEEAREAFYKMLFYIVFSMLDSIVLTEVRSILGRADVVIQTDDDVFVLELKVDKTVDEALQQIEDKGYAIPYSADGRRLTKCGISISSDARNIVHWKAVDEMGNILDEKKF